MLAHRALKKYGSRSLTPPRVTRVSINSDWHFERRLAPLLLLLANFGKDGRPVPISPNISQETLAEMIGTTRVGYFVNKFRKLGLINYNGHIEVHSVLLNAVLHDKPQLKEDQ